MHQCLELNGEKEDQCHGMNLTMLQMDRLLPTAPQGVGGWVSRHKTAQRSLCPVEQDGTSKFAGLSI